VSGVYAVVLVFLVVALIALVVVWYVARRMKSDFDTSPSAVTGSRATLELSADSVLRLRELSQEPILLKQGEEGVRVQIEHRPMLPLMAFVGKGEVSAALNEAAARVSEQWGPQWVVLLSSRDDGTVSAQRLA
jgi:hypothetical protein